MSCCEDQVRKCKGEPKENYEALRRSEDYRYCQLCEFLHVLSIILCIFPTSPLTQGGSDLLKELVVKVRDMKLLAWRQTVNFIL